MDQKPPLNPTQATQPPNDAPTATTIGAPATVDSSSTSADAAVNTADAAAPGNATPTSPGAVADDRTAAMCSLLARNWWAVALRGVVAILFGLFALLAPGPTLISLALLFGAYLLVDGIFGIVAAVRAANRSERWGLLLAEGVVNLVMGVVALVFPVSAVVAFVLVTAAWALLTGGLMVAAAFRLSAEHGRWWLVLGGVASVIFGVLLLLSPLVGAVVLAWWLGAYALVFGAMLLGLAFKLKGRRDSAPPVERGAAAAGAR
jgi:uncharacterized membrane protein HdeD (DUF308 family)